ncbi:MAG: phosphate ABC transporter permease [Chloroflexi bacterium]|nr:MAG: phosphate ABC transporter permease [Chloroflexota bacterium]
MIPVKLLSNEFRPFCITGPWKRLQPSRGWTSLNLTELWQYRELAYFLAWRDVKVRYKQTVIGVAWVLLQPLAMMGVFWLLFGRIAQLPSDDVPYPLYLLVALVPWQFFSRVIADSTNSLITDQRLITRVYFPRLVVPIATALTALVDFSLAMCLVVLSMIWVGIVPGSALLFLPIAVLLMATAALGIGFWLSALNVEYRDVMHAVPFLVQFWFFVTPVIYGTSILPDSWQWVFAFNPMTSVVETFRWCLLNTPQTGSYISAISAVLAIGSFFTGMIWFRRRERFFVDSLGGGA